MPISKRDINTIIDLVKESFITDDAQLSRFHTRLCEEKRQNDRRKIKSKQRPQTDSSQNDEIKQHDNSFKRHPIEVVCDDLLNDLEKTQPIESASKKKTTGAAHKKEKKSKTEKTTNENKKTTGADNKNEKKSKTEKTTNEKKKTIGADNKKEKKSKTKKASKINTDTKRAKNPYFEYLNTERVNIKADLLAENAELNGRDLITSITKEAGRRWKEMSAEEKQPYMLMNVELEKEKTVQIHESIESCDEQKAAAVDEPCCDDHAEQEEEEEDASDRIFNETHGVWIDPEILFYYESLDSESPIGQFIRDKTVPFKTNKQ